MKYCHKLYILCARLESILMKLEQYYDLIFYNNIFHYFNWNMFLLLNNK